MTTVSPYMTAVDHRREPARFGSFWNREPKAPQLKFYFAPNAVLGCSSMDSRPMPVLDDVYETDKLPEGVTIDEWPVYALAPKHVPLQTAGMVDCTALRIDGPGDEHYLMHLNPIDDVPAVAQHLREDIPWDLTDENTTIDIIPGTCEPATTIENILRALHRIHKDLPKKVRFHHFPVRSAEWGRTLDEDGSGLNNPRAVVSYDGDIFCRDRKSAQPPFTRGGRPVSPNHPPIAEFA